MALLRTLLSGAALTIAAASISVGAVAIAYVNRIVPDLPPPTAVTEWKAREGTTILAADGSVLGVHAREFRKFVPLDVIPPRVWQAFIAAEDGSYWEHRGVDPKAIVRAALSNLRGSEGRVEGGSTITQQVVKNLVLTPERTFDRKAKEALLALKIDREVGKSRVLEIYLNEIYLGAGAYGVAAAAEVYFGKTLSELSLGEAALLAGLPQAPSAANPFTKSARALERRNYVLDRMAAEGFVTTTQAESAKAMPVVIASRDSALRGAGASDAAFWYPEETVRRMLVQSFGSDRIYREGGVVKTHIRPVLQQIVHRELRAGLVKEDRHAGWRGAIAQGIQLPVDWDAQALAAPEGAEDWQVGVVVEASKDAVVETRDGEVVLKGEDLAWASSKRRASSFLKPGDAILLGDLGNGLELVQLPETQGAVVILDPSNGNVLALDGGFSHELSEFNRATQAKRQTGSVFKSFVYLAAAERGFDAMSPVLDSPISLSQGPGLEDWRPQNGEKGMGLITLRRTAELSRNMATVRLLYDIGQDSVADVARRAGFSLPENLNWAVALGAAETTPLNVATAYSAIANGGFRVEPRFYVDTSDSPSAERVFDPVSVAQVSSILEGVVHNGTAQRAFDGFDLPLAAKTGTTNDARDAWFAAYGPRFVAVAWVGKDDHKPLSKASSGGGTVAPIMRRILDQAAATSELEFAPFSLPHGATTVLADRETGLPAEDGDVLEIVRSMPEAAFEAEVAPIDDQADLGSLAVSNP